MIAGSSQRSGCVRYIHHDDVKHEMLNGVRVTALDETAFESMRAVPFHRALGIADSYLRISGRSRDESIGFISRLKYRRRGVRHVKEVLSHADARSENGGESYARAVMIEEGVELPELQVEYRIPGPAPVVYRVDFDWTHSTRCKMRAVGELDGIEKIRSPDMLKGRTPEEVLREERNRESELMNIGLKVVRFTFDDCKMTEPLLRKLSSAGIPGAAEAWCRWQVGPHAVGEVPVGEPSGFDSKSF